MKEFIFFLQSTLLQNIALILTLIVLVFYTKETYRLRKTAESANRLSIMPFAMVSFNEPKKNIWVFEASNKSIILNYKVFARHNETSKEKVIENGLAMGPGHRYMVGIDFWDTRNEYQYFVEYQDVQKNNYRTTWKPNDPQGLKFEKL